jgi:beta-phosphoglucomutase-like phosphatase (HAD superfamily)
MDSPQPTDLSDVKRSPQQFRLFIDDGGVLNDNRIRGGEWLRLIGEFMPARLGGTPEQWAIANSAVFPQVWADLTRQMPLFASFEEFQRTYATSWMRLMCAEIGIAAPPDYEAAALYTQLAVYIAERERCAIPGAATAVLALRRAGYAIYTASGTPSWELRPMMARMGIIEAFSGFYGPDLVDQMKYGPAFYDRLFSHARVTPSRALVIDNDPECCRWAEEAGARVAWLDLNGRGDAATLEELLQELV